VTRAEHLSVVFEPQSEPVGGVYLSTRGEQP
jgi:hypothetical protein